VSPAERDPAKTFFMHDPSLTFVIEADAKSELSTQFKWLRHGEPSVPRRAS